VKSLLYDEDPASNLSDFEILVWFKNRENEEFIFLKKGF